MVKLLLVKVILCMEFTGFMIIISLVLLISTIVAFMYIEKTLTNHIIALGLC